LDLYEPNQQKPFVGEYDVILNSHAEPVCVTMTDTVRTMPFLEVDADDARHEGEGNRSLDSWRQTHAAFFAKEYARAGRKFDSQTAQLLLETFHVVYPLKD